MTGWNEEGFSSSLGLLHLQINLGFKHWTGATLWYGSNDLHLSIAHCDQNTSATVLKLMAQANTTGYMFLKHITGAWLPGAA